MRFGLPDPLAHPIGKLQSFVDQSSCFAQPSKSQESLGPLGDNDRNTDQSPAVLPHFRSSGRLGITLLVVGTRDPCQPVMPKRNRLQKRQAALTRNCEGLVQTSHCVLYVPAKSQGEVAGSEHPDEIPGVADLTREP